jgi:thiamine-phosphate pyrophosphorylase
MCKGGAKIIQLREKNISKEIFLKTALKAREITKMYGTKLIVNDSLFVAYHSKADGIHLGQEDESPTKARKILGKDAIIGLSVQNLSLLQEAKKMPINYIGCGAVFPTKTHNTKNLLGLNGLKLLRQHSPFPVVAIGGIHKNNFESVIRTEIDSIAMVSEIMTSKNIESTVFWYIKTFQNIRKDCLFSKNMKKFS